MEGTGVRIDTGVVTGGIGDVKLPAIADAAVEGITVDGVALKNR